MPRIARSESSTSIYHVVNRGLSKQMIFEDYGDRTFFMQRLADLLDDAQGKLHAWCLMDNHFHLLCNVPFETLGSLMHRLQTAYVGRFNRIHGRTGALFGSRFKSEPVEDEAYLASVMRYIHENPRKAGMVNGFVYDWSSYKEYAGQQVFVDPSLLLELFGGRKQLLAFHEIPHVDKCMDIDHDRGQLCDSDALRLVEREVGRAALHEIKCLDRKKRDSLIVQMKAMGIGVRQIQRLTGLSLSVVSRAKAS